MWRIIKPRRPTEEGIVRIGHFTYGHVLPVVELGQVVKPGQLIGWTTKGEWHLHLSEWRFPGGTPNQNRQIQVNPLDPEGKIAPYRDTAAPVIREIRFHQPVDSAWRTPWVGRLLPRRHPPRPEPALGPGQRPPPDGGLQSFRGWWRDVPLLETDHHPARVHLPRRPGG